MWLFKAAMAAVETAYGERRETPLRPLHDGACGVLDGRSEPVLNLPVRLLSSIGIVRYGSATTLVPWREEQGERRDEEPWA
jgi:hypothetical protein